MLEKWFGDDIATYDEEEVYANIANMKKCLPEFYCCIIVSQMFKLSHRSLTKVIQDHERDRHESQSVYFSIVTTS